MGQFGFVICLALAPVPLPLPLPLLLPRPLPLPLPVTTHFTRSLFLCSPQQSFFLRAIRTMGVREQECFDTADLFDEKDLLQVRLYIALSLP